MVFKDISIPSYYKYKIFKNYLIPSCKYKYQRIIFINTNVIELFRTSFITYGRSFLVLRLIGGTWREVLTGVPAGDINEPR